MYHLGRSYNRKMPATTDAPTLTWPEGSGWLFYLRTLTAIFAVLLCLAATADFARRDLFVGLASLWLASAFGAAFWGLRSPVGRFGPALVVGLLLALIVPLVGRWIWGIQHSSLSHSAWLSANLKVFFSTLVLPVVLLGLLAMGAYAGLRLLVDKAMDHQGTRSFVVGAGGAVCSLVFVGAVAIASQIRNPNYTPSGVGSLRTLCTAEVTHAYTYKKGFSVSLAALGPAPDGATIDASHAYLIDGVLASGLKSGYRIEYTPGPVGDDGRISAFAVVARPQEFGRTGVRSFYTDQTCVIRSTGENRAATAQDEPIR